MAAAFATGAVVLFGKSAVSAASSLASAMTGLKSVLDGTGKSFADGQKFINDYIKDGLVPATNAINAYKNLAIRGYNTDQIEKTMIALKDSAAFARQGSLTMGEAIQGASEGLIFSPHRKQFPCA
jgi:phage tail tape-measure protein